MGGPYSPPWIHDQEFQAWLQTPEGRAEMARHGIQPRTPVAATQQQPQGSPQPGMTPANAERAAQPQPAGSAYGRTGQIPPMPPVLDQQPGFQPTQPGPPIPVTDTEQPPEAPPPAPMAAQFPMQFPQQRSPFAAGGPASTVAGPPSAFRQEPAPTPQMDLGPMPDVSGTVNEAELAGQAGDALRAGPPEPSDVRMKREHPVRYRMMSILTGGTNRYRDSLREEDAYQEQRRMEPVGRYGKFLEASGAGGKRVQDLQQQRAVAEGPEGAFKRTVRAMAEMGVKLSPDEEQQLARMQMGLQKGFNEPFNLDMTDEEFAALPYKTQVFLSVMSRMQGGGDAKKEVARGVTGILTDNQPADPYQSTLARERAKDESNARDRIGPLRSGLERGTASIQSGIREADEGVSREEANRVRVQEAAGKNEPDLLYTDEKGKEARLPASPEDMSFWNPFAADRYNPDKLKPFFDTFERNKAAAQQARAELLQKLSALNRNFYNQSMAQYLLLTGGNQQQALEMFRSENPDFQGMELVP